MNATKPFKAIAAISKNRVIGNAGDIPWHLPEDFKWFKKTTMGDVLVMGRKTYESIGRPLPGRETFVLSRKPQEIEGVQIKSSLQELEDLETNKTIWIAGGAEIYSQAMDRCNEVMLTRVHRTVEGDTFFPTFEDSFELSETILETEDFTIERWIAKV